MVSTAPSASMSGNASASSSRQQRVFARSHASRSVGHNNGTFLTECSFGVAHDRLVEVLTDVEPFEPHWETLSTVDLSERRLESAARLKEFLPALDALNLCVALRFPLPSPLWICVYIYYLYLSPFLPYAFLFYSILLYPTLFLPNHHHALWDIAAICDALLSRLRRLASSSLTAPCLADC